MTTAQDGTLSELHIVQLLTSKLMLTIIVDTAHSWSDSFYLNVIVSHHWSHWSHWRGRSSSIRQSLLVYFCSIYLIAPSICLLMKSSWETFLVSDAGFIQQRETLNNMYRKLGGAHTGSLTPNIKITHCWSYYTNNSLGGGLKQLVLLESVILVFFFLSKMLSGLKISLLGGT